MIGGAVGALDGATIANHNIVRKHDGALWAWGYDGFGQLGLGDTIDRSTPARVPPSLR